MKAALDRHSRKCIICHNLADYRTIYRHARASGLLLQRRVTPMSSTSNLNIQIAHRGAMPPLALPCPELQGAHPRKTLGTMPPRSTTPMNLTPTPTPRMLGVRQQAN